MPNCAGSKAALCGLLLAQKGSDVVGGAGETCVLRGCVLKMLMVYGSRRAHSKCWVLTRAFRQCSCAGIKAAICEMPFAREASDVAGGAGGTCVLLGCVPKKLMVFGGRRAHSKC